MAAAASPRASSEEAARAGTVTEFTVTPQAGQPTKARRFQSSKIEFQQGLLQNHAEGGQGQKTQISAVSQVKCEVRGQ